MKIHKKADNRYAFFCPGCKCGHIFKTEGPGPVWTFNGDMEKPTIRASIMVHGQVYPSGGTWPTDEEHAQMMAGKTMEMKKTVCHSFITDGEIEFLSDCTHELTGKKVPLEEF
jgi:Family of unknown function (DUF6527)